MHFMVILLLVVLARKISEDQTSRLLGEPESWDIRANWEEDTEKDLHISKGNLEVCMRSGTATRIFSCVIL